MTKTFTQKIVAVATALTLSGMLAGPVYGQTAADLQAQINALLAQLATLQSQLSAMGGGTAVSCSFTRPLYPGVSGDDVKCLQQYLNGAGFQVAASGAGSPGSETMYFGSLTQAAVMKWQDANGIVYGAYGGYFGPVSQAKYNSLGGAVATPAPTTGVAPAEVTTPGVEAIVSVEYAPSPANSPVIKEGQELGAFGVRIKVKQGDGVFERLKFRLGTATTIYARQFTEAALFDGETELARKVLNSTTVVKDGSDYVLTLDGFKRLIKAGTEADFVVRLKAYSQIDSTYTDTDPSALRVEANGVRVIDGAGINQYAPTNALGTRTVDLQQSEAEQAGLIWSRNADYPRAYRVVSDSQGEADKVVMDIYDAKAQRGRVKITDWRASITESEAGSSSAATGYLYRKDGSSWKLLASASLANGGFNWADLTDEWVAKDVTNTYKVEVKFTGASSDSSTWNIVNPGDGDLAAENDLGDSVTASESVATSSDVLVRNAGPIYTLKSKSIKYTKASVSGASGTLEGTFVVNVKAEGSSIFVSTTTTGAFVVTTTDDDGTATTTASLGTVTFTQPSGSVSQTNSYEIPQGQSVDFTVNYAALSGRIDAQAGFDLGESYKLRISTIRWGLSDTTTDANSDTFMDTAQWETNFVFVSD